MEFLNIAITSHLGWTSRLVDAIKRDMKLDRRQSSVDNECDFGKWVYGEGLAKYSEAPDFLDVRKRHAVFHECVGTVLDLIEAGNKQEAIDAIRDGAFRKCSDELVAAVKKLKAGVGA